MAERLTIAHLSDTHLGYRAFAKEDPKTGVNQREVDVYQAFVHALRAITEAPPDLVLITGDLFDKKVPSIWSLRQAFRALRRLQEVRRGKPLILLGGNHDTPRSRESSAVFPLFEEIPGIKVVYGMPLQVDLPELGASVMCVPAAGAARLVEEGWKPEPNSRAKFNILAVHGVLQGMYTTEYTPFYLPLSRVLDERWDYIALGDYHDFRQLSPNAAYAGATEFTTTNIWNEAPHKGWVEVQVEQGNPPRIRLHRVPTRQVISLSDVDVAQCASADEAIEQVLAQAADMQMEGALVRVRLFNLPYGERARAYRTITDSLPNAFHVQVDFRSTLRWERGGEETSTETAPMQPIEERWRQFVEARRGQLPVGIEAEEVVQRGLEALNAVGEEVSS